MSTNNQNAENIKHVVLFSTKLVGTEGTLFENFDSCSPFMSADLYDCLLSKSDTFLLDILGCTSAEKEKALEDIENFIADDTIKKELEVYRYKMPDNYEAIKQTVEVIVGTLSPEKLERWKSVCKKYESAKDAASLFDEKYQKEVVDPQTKQIIKRSNASALSAEFSKIKEKTNFSNKDNKYNSYFNRFFLYRYDENNSESSAVYGIKNLSVAIKEKNKWFNALCNEIVERHKNCEVILLVLHDKDISSTGCRFCIQEGEYENSFNNIERTVVLFQHTLEDPMMKVLNSPKQGDDIFETIKNLVQKKNILDTYGVISRNIADNKDDTILVSEVEKLPNGDKVKVIVLEEPSNRIKILEQIEMSRRNIEI
jgi:hypothetical protein